MASRRCDRESSWRSDSCDPQSDLQPPSSERQQLNLSSYRPGAYSFKLGSREHMKSSSWRGPSLDLSTEQQNHLQDSLVEPETPSLEDHVKLPEDIADAHQDYKSHQPLFFKWFDEQVLTHPDLKPANKHAKPRKRDIRACVIQAQKMGKNPPPSEILDCLDLVIQRRDEVGDWYEEGKRGTQEDRDSHKAWNDGLKIIRCLLMYGDTPDPSGSMIKPNPREMRKESRRRSVASRVEPYSSRGSITARRYSLRSQQKSSESRSSPSSRGSTTTRRNSLRSQKSSESGPSRSADGSS